MKEKVIYGFNYISNIFDKIDLFCNYSLVSNLYLQKNTVSPKAKTGK